jgi:hypothetical protein
MFAIVGPAQFVGKNLRTIEGIHFFEFSTRDFFLPFKSPCDGNVAGGKVRRQIFEPPFRPLGGL